MAAPPPDISVLIVTWNSARHVSACLQSLARALEGIAHEVWIADNASGDDSIAAARRYCPTAHVIANRDNLGFARAANQALERSAGRYLLLLNPDTEVNAHALRGMMEILDAHPDAGLVGCRLVGADGETHECYGLTYPGIRSRSPAIRPPASQAPLTEAAWLGGACILARRAAIEAVGGLDPDFFMYYEDVDWGLRMRRRGWRVLYWHEGGITHHLGGSSAPVPPRETARRYLVSEMVFHGKHGAPAIRMLVCAARTLRALRGAAYYGLLRRVRPAADARCQYYLGWLDALLGKVRRPTETSAPAPACRLCGARAQATLAKIEGCTIVRCLTCGLGQTLPRQTRAQYDRAYLERQWTGGDPAPQQVERAVRAEGLRVRRVARALDRAPMPRGRRLLEIGPGHGYFLEAARRRGFEVQGLEVSSAAAEFCRTRFGLRVMVGAVEDADLAPEPFDVIAAWHVLEHLHDPVAALRRMAALVAPGGVVAVEVPDYESYDARVQGQAWEGWQPRYHRWHFTPGALARMLADSGLAVERVWHAPSRIARERLKRIPVLGLARPVLARRFAGTGVAAIARKAHAD